MPCPIRPPRFDAKWNRRRNRRRWWSGLRRSGRWLLLIAAIVLGKAALDRWMAPPPAQWSHVQVAGALCGSGSAGFCVLDGDTVAMGFGPQGRRIRLTGFDAPEMDAQCPAQRAKAQEAKAELRRWMARGAFEWDGGADPPRDQYGRELRNARRSRDGEEALLADHMIAAGLAEGSGWGAAAIDWCAP